MAHKDNTASALVKQLRLEQKKELATDLVNALEQGHLFPDDLDPDIRERLVSLLEGKWL
jgi:hypothetical protein